MPSSGSLSNGSSSSASCFISLIYWKWTTIYLSDKLSLFLMHFQAVTDTFSFSLKLPIWELQLLLYFVFYMVIRVVSTFHYYWQFQENSLSKNFLVLSRVLELQRKKKSEVGIRRVAKKQSSASVRRSCMELDGLRILNFL